MGLAATWLRLISIHHSFGHGVFDPFYFFTDPLAMAFQIIDIDNDFNLYFFMSCFDSIHSDLFTFYLGSELYRHLNF